LTQKSCCATSVSAGQTWSPAPLPRVDYLRDDPHDPTRKLIRQVLGAVSEFERSLIKLRLQRGRALKAERGGFAFGAPPFGFGAEGGELVPVDREQEARVRDCQVRQRDQDEVTEKPRRSRRRTDHGGSTGPADNGEPAGEYEQHERLENRAHEGHPASGGSFRREGADGLRGERPLVDHLLRHALINPFTATVPRVG
jgi:hypothetical protein